MQNRKRTIHPNEDRRLFNRIAAGYLRKDLLPAHRLARRQRLDRSLAGVALEPDADILEVGCGAGFSSDYLYGRYRSYVGIDHSEELIGWANKFQLNRPVRFEATDIFSFRTDQSFHLVLAIGVLHHLEDPLQALMRLSNMLIQGGWLIVNEPQEANFLIRMARRIRKILDSNYSPDQMAFSAETLTEYFKKAGLNKVFTRPQGFFSTPFAEVVMPFQGAMSFLARMACIVDTKIENHLAKTLQSASWNLVAGGQRPR